MALENNQTLRVNLIANTAGMAAGLSTASQQLQAFSNKARAIGRNLTTSLTLPMGLVGGAAIKSALDFDKSMTKITTLVGVASSEVDSMRGTVKRMAADTGVGASAAADAMFFITSAGLRGSDALKVLEASSKASAIGLGEVKTVADAVTSAVNAYGIENLSAESATDVLTAAVREGKLEADSLAQSMGKVLPVSSQLGVRFDEVGAALAAMSRTGTDAAMASTSLRGILNGLMNPTSQANEQLEEYGLSAQGLREQLKEKGLLSVLKTLTDEFGDNQEAAGKVFGNVRALTGVLDLMGKNVGATEEIFKSLTDTTGTTQKGFEDLQNSLEFKFRITWNKLKVSFTELGQTLAVKIFPLIEKAISFFTTLINKFNNLDTSTQNLVLTIAGIAAAIGPATIAVSALASAFALLSSPIVLIVASIAVIAAAIEHAIKKIDAIKLRFEQFFETVKLQALAFKEYLKNLLDSETREAIQRGLAKVLTALGKEYDAKIAELDMEDSLIDKISQTITNVYDDFKQAGAGLGKAIGDGINEGIVTPLQRLKQLVGDAVIETSNQVALSTGNTWDSLNAQLESSAQLAEERARKVQAAAERQASLVSNAMGSIISHIANSISKMFETGVGSVREFALGVMSILGDLAIQIGTMAILANKAVTEMLIPGIGVAAGFALIAIGAAMKGLSAKLQTEGVKTFAAGGLVYGPTQALIGEYPGARSNPEVVAPLNKLKNYIGGRSGNENMMVGEFTLRGQDLVVALQRAERNRNRFK